ncbi:MAG: FAD-binding oxidoreductase [Elusimicrobia bacterium]|nr:FAD-binding oxidoreductase [Elusimicrobiota bacterium]
MIIKTEKDTVQSYFEDQSGLLGGHAHKIYIPENEFEIIDFLKEMSQKKTPVTISGSGTGVTGGRIPFGGVVLSLERLNKIIEIKSVSKDQAYAVVQSGVIVQELKKQAENLGWLYPPDPTEQNSFIGGNIATNASGSRGFKFGSTREYVNKIKVILSNGELIHIKRGEIFASKEGVIALPLKNGKLNIKLPSYKLPNIKNAAGYFNLPGMDLIDLFIGSEGTLGVITEAEVRLIPKISKIFSGVAFFPKKELAWKFALEIRKISLNTRKKKQLLDIDALSIEYLDKNTLKLLKDKYPQIPDFSDASIMFEQETSSVNEDIIIEKWSKVLEKYDAPLDKIWFGTSLKDSEGFRDFRHEVPEKVNEIVRKNKFPKTGTDIAVPENNLIKLLEYFYKTAVKEEIDYLVFGHIGDCHLHANFLPKNVSEFNRCKEIYKNIVGKTIDLKGTVSAEHGIGKLKHIFIEKMLGISGIMEMARIKKKIDSASILGLGNIFPAELTKKV